MKFIMQALDIYGARTRNRTGTPLRAGDFKSHASTSFAIRAVARSSLVKRRIRGTDSIEAGAAEGRNIYIPPRRSKVAQVLFKTKASLPHKEKSSVNHRSTELFYSGGRSRNRTGVGGFAIHCITILLFGLKTPDAIKPHQPCTYLVGRKPLAQRYLLENIEVFYTSTHSMGAIMYSFAKADNPLISKKNRPAGGLSLLDPAAIHPAGNLLIGNPKRRWNNHRRGGSFLMSPSIDKENHHD